MDEKPKNKIYKRWWFWVLVIIALYILISRLIFPLFIMQGESMDPTLKPNSLLLTTRFFTPQRGDVVVFNASFIPGYSNQIFIKRIIGLPGDKIEIKNGQVYINDKLLNEPYVKGATNSVMIGSQAYNSNPIVLGNGQFYLLGDNRAHSYDSRSFGPVLKSYIIDKVIFQ